MYDTVFDALYWSLGGVMLLAFIGTIGRSASDLRRSAGDRSQREATLAVAVGALLTLVVGIGLNGLRSVTGDLFYQQGHFVLFYVGFGLVLWGFDRVGMLGDHASAPGRRRRTITWGAFALSTGAALVGLLTPDSYRIVSGGDVRYVQEPLFFVPLFVVLAAGAIQLPTWLVVAERQTARPWLAALAASMLIGMLREPAILPATDQPIVDLLLAFGPFTLAALFLFRAASVGNARRRISNDAAAISP